MNKAKSNLLFLYWKHLIKSIHNIQYAKTNKKEHLTLIVLNSLKNKNKNKYITRLLMKMLFSLRIERNLSI